MRTMVGKTLWPALLSSIVLVMVVASSPVVPLREGDARVPHDGVALGAACEVGESTLVFTAPAPQDVPDRLNGDKCDEKDEEETFGAFSSFVSPACVYVDLPTNLLNGPRVRGSISGAATVPLRC